MKKKKKKQDLAMFTFILANNPQKLHVKHNDNMLCLNTAHYVLPIYVINKKGLC